MHQQIHHVKIQLEVRAKWVKKVEMPVKRICIFSEVKMYLIIPNCIEKLDRKVTLVHSADNAVFNRN